MRVRRALLMGIDRQSMVDKLMGGRVPTADSFVSPLTADLQRRGARLFI